MEQLPSLLLCAVIGYLLGSVSAGILYSHLLGSDIRRHGSKNPGASNMLRIYGMNAGTITFIFDCAKAIGAVLLGRLIAGQNGAMAAGFFAIIGHNWPLYFGFKGGKGIAATAGLILAIHPAFIPMGVILFFGTFLLTHYVSLGSLLVYAGFLIEMVIMGQMDLFFMPVGHRAEMYVIAAFLTAMAYWKHRENIKRLLSGTERKTYLFKKNKEALN